MQTLNILLVSLLSLFLFNACEGVNPDKAAVQNLAVTSQENVDNVKEIIVGAARFAEYLPIIRGKKIAIVVNQTSQVNGTHLVDSLLKLKIDIVKIFAPEHGFRGTADAGEQVKDGLDTRTGLPVISLYGKNKKPSVEMLEGIDYVLFDIQDVGARFYTYISTMTYVMEACAEQKIPVLVLDRPNPNGHFVDGPVLEKPQQSFVGLHPVPIIHGMTVAEYARMVNGEKWLNDGIQCDLHYVTCLNYDHKTFYELPVKPSPNLPNMQAIYLYPHLCLLEGTQVSVGRGTDKQFQVTGHPACSDAFSFTPVPKPGAKYPKHENVVCKGNDLSTLSLDELRKFDRFQLDFLLDMYAAAGKPVDFFLKNNFFNRLAGNTTLMQQIKDGVSEEEIRASWKDDVEAFEIIRKQYLLYR